MPVTAVLASTVLLVALDIPSAIVSFEAEVEAAKDREPGGRFGTVTERSISRFSSPLNLVLYGIRV